MNYDNEDNEIDTQEIANNALEVLTAYFMESDGGLDNDLLINVLSDNLDAEELDNLEGDELVAALQDISMTLSGMYSGMLMHVVNLIRIIGMMSLQSENEAYINYVQYYHHLLPTYENIDSEEGAVEYMTRLHKFFGWDPEDETE
jgi:hypothetical protein|tara:strand:- start:13585 stop:14019 length:435 start_codon:yes stop_codon:yes gene_type:complete